jgi:hypothetical protein
MMVRILYIFMGVWFPHKRAETHTTDNADVHPVKLMTTFNVAFVKFCHLHQNCQTALSATDTLHRITGCHRYNKCNLRRKQNQRIGAEKNHFK